MTENTRLGSPSFLAKERRAEFDSPLRSIDNRGKVVLLAASIFILIGIAATCGYLLPNCSGLNFVRTLFYSKEGMLAGATIGISGGFTLLVLRMVAKSYLSVHEKKSSNDLKADDAAKEDEKPDSINNSNLVSESSELHKSSDGVVRIVSVDTSEEEEDGTNSTSDTESELRKTSDNEVETSSEESSEDEHISSSPIRSHPNLVLDSSKFHESWRDESYERICSKPETSWCGTFEAKEKEVRIFTIFEGEKIKDVRNSIKLIVELHLEESCKDDPYLLNPDSAMALTFLELTKMCCSGKRKTAATVVTLIDNVLTVGNVGKCRTVLYSKGDTFQLISSDYLNRSDADYINSMHQGEYFGSFECDSADNGLSFIVIASSDLWKVMTGKEVTDFIVDKRNEDKSVEEANSELLEEAQSRGLTKEITLIIVPLVFSDISGDIKSNRNNNLYWNAMRKGLHNKVDGKDYWQRMADINAK